MSLHVSLRQIDRTFGRPLRALLVLSALQIAAIAYLWINHWPPIRVSPFFPWYDEDFAHTFLVYGMWISDACFAALFCTLAVTSWRSRLAIVVITYSVLVLNYVLFPRLALAYHLASLGALIVDPSVVTLIAAIVLRRAGFSLERDRAQSVAECRSGFRFSIRDIFGFTAAAAILIVAGRYLVFVVKEIDVFLERRYLLSDLFRVFYFGVLYAGPCIPVALSLLGSCRVVWRLFLAVAAVGFVAEWVRRSPDDFPVGLIFVSAATTSVLSALALRFCGYRLQRRGVNS